MNIQRTISLLAGIIVLTVVQVGALAIWLELVRDTHMTPEYALLGITTLVVGFSLEQILTDITINGIHDDIPLGPLVFVGVFEAVIWIAWLSLAQNIGELLGILVAGVTLTALLVPLHTVADNVVRRDGLFDSTVDGRTVDFSIVEGLGATVWLLLVVQSERVGEFWIDTRWLGTELGGDAAVIGLGVLTVALFAEHIIGVRFGLRT